LVEGDDLVFKDLAERPLEPMFYGTTRGFSVSLLLSLTCIAFEIDLQDCRVEKKNSPPYSVT
jgi:hypothetical protein